MNYLQSKVDLLEIRQTLFLFLSNVLIPAEKKEVMTLNLEYVICRQNYLLVV